MKQTAVDWLHHKILNPTSHELLEDINLWFQKAKEMEKEQIEDAYWEGIFNGEFLDGQGYYNETYGKK
jgi:hypothetical protein